MADYFFSESPTILPFEGTGIGYKSIVKLKLFAQPMHQIFVIKYCILLKSLVYQNKNELLGTSLAFMMIVSRFEKKSLPTKILSSFALITQPHQNIANRSD